jgi:AcrR family transcriptional regulator
MKESRGIAEGEEGPGVPERMEPRPGAADARSRVRPGASDAGSRARPGAAGARSRLLKEGRKLFATKGFKGTSIRALTTAAGVNLGAVTYHFGSKEGLYHEVLEDCLSPLKDRVAEVGNLSLPPMDRVEQVVRRVFHHIRENPDLPRFFVQEAVLGEKLSPAVRGMIGTLLGTLIRALEEGHGEGGIVPGDPVLQALSVLSQPVYLSVIGAVLGREARRHPGLPVPSTSAEDHAVALLRRGLAPREENHP